MSTGEKLTPMEFMEKYADGVYEFRYQMVKDAVFELYLWGFRTNNDDVIKFYKQMLRLYRTYDKKFMRAKKPGEENVP